MDEAFGSSSSHRGRLRCERRGLTRSIHSAPHLAESMIFIGARAVSAAADQRAVPRRRLKALARPCRLFFPSPIFSETGVSSVGWSFFLGVIRSEVFVWVLGSGTTGG